MFGIDFSELVVIMLVALVVIGPERLPKVARTLGHLWARAQRYINGVKADISRDMAIDEFRQMQKKVQEEVLGAEQAMKQVGQALDHQVQDINSMVAQPAKDIAQHADAISQTVSGALQPATGISQPVSGGSQQAQLELQLPAEQKKFPVD
jgi:sec-independent protein translocase protein TatB